jgi:hypothetical protein
MFRSLPAWPAVAGVGLQGRCWRERAGACGGGVRFWAPSSAAAGARSSSPMPEMSSSVPMPSSSMSMGGGALPMGAEHMHVAIVSPAAMTKVTGNSVMVQVRVTGYTDTCALAGKHVMGMEATTTGHYHVLLDGALVNMYCTPAAVVSLQNVRPGCTRSRWRRRWMTTHRSPRTRTRSCSTTRRPGRCPR